MNEKKLQQFVMETGSKLEILIVVLFSSSFFSDVFSAVIGYFHRNYIH